MSDMNGEGFQPSTSMPDLSALEERFSEGATTEQGAVSNEQGQTPAQPATSQEEPFFDASKVPAELQASFKEMQAAFTKKTQELSDVRKFVEQYGGVDELQGFLGQFDTQEGVLNLFVNIARQLGAQDDQILALVQGQQATGQQPEPQTQQPQAANDPNRFMTREEFQQWQQSMAEQQAIEADDKALEQALSENKVPNEALHFVLAAAYRYPLHLGYAERVKRGMADYTQALEAHAQQAATQREEVRQTTPAPLNGGSAPMPQGEGPARSLDEARARARQRPIFRDE